MASNTQAASVPPSSGDLIPDGVSLPSMLPATPLITSRSPLFSTSLPHLPLLNSTIPFNAHITNFVTIRLDSGNHLLWKRQLLLILRLHRKSHVLKNPPPPIYVTSPQTGQLLPNPDYDIWVQDNLLVLSWILSTLSESTLAHVINCNTTCDAWETLEHTFSSHSTSRMMHLSKKLHTLDKPTTQTMADYLKEVKTISDTLAVAGRPVRDDVLVSFALQRLENEYPKFVSGIVLRRDLVSFIEHHD